VRTCLAVGILAGALLIANLPASAEGDGPRARARLQQKKEHAAQQKKNDAAAQAKATVWAASAPVPASAPVAKPAGVPAAPAASAKGAAAKASCPDSPTAWVAWRDNSILELLRLGKDPYDDNEVDSDPAVGGEAYLDNVHVMSRSTRLARFIDDCEAAGFGPRAVAMGNLTLFVRANRNADYQSNLENQFGHQMKDHSYLKKVRPQIELPCLLKHETFLDLISRPATYHEAQALIREQNDPGVDSVLGCPTDKRRVWRSLFYKSQFLPTPDNAETFGRFFVLVEGKEKDQYDSWIQFGVWLPGDSDEKLQTPIQNVSIVSVSRSDDPRAEKRVDAMADWWRVDKDGKFGLELKLRRLTPPYQTDNCLRCHKTLPIGIYPEAIYDIKPSSFSHPNPALLAKANPAVALSDDAAAVVDYLRKYIFQNYRRAPVYELDAADGIASPNNYGPAMGPKGLRSAQFMNDCTTSEQRAKPGFSIDRVNANMNCVRCHDGQAKNTENSLHVGLLNYPLATEKRVTRDKESRSFANIAHSRITQAAMPPPLRPGHVPSVDHPEPPQSPEERDALYACLSKEYFDTTTIRTTTMAAGTTTTTTRTTPTGLFVDWLRK